MENASKALLIAAGILIGLILITMIIYGYGQISSYYEAKEANKETEQLVEFNKQYIGYNRDDVRGSDLLSLVNKIIDYNEPKIDDVNEEKINISIYIDDIESFYYNYSDNKSVKLIKSYYTQDNINNDLVKPADEIESIYAQGMANKLANNLSVLFITDETKARNRTTFLEDQKVADTGDVLTKDILKYYQYVQFKRAHFDCEDLTYKDRKSKKLYI